MNSLDPTTDFILELSYPKNHQHVSRVIQVLTYMENNASNFDLDSNADLLGSPRKSWINWLLRVVEIHGAAGVSGWSGDEICESITKFVARLSGQSAYGPKVVEFNMGDVFKLKLKEPSFAEADLGWKTWPAGVYLAYWLTKYKPKLIGDFVELGCGTGMVGLTSATLYPRQSHWLTDYHPSVIGNANRNAQLNNIQNVRVAELNWDWFQSWDPKECCDPVQLPAEWSKKKESFGIVYATDVLYQFQHAQSVPRVIRYLLNLKGLAYICIPVRYSHIKDTIEFESQLSRFLTIVCQINLQTPVKQAEWEWFNTVGLFDLKELEGRYDSLKELTTKEKILDCTAENNVLGYRLYISKRKSNR
jgi:predicted nicotinamide N-methyase